MVCDRFPQSEAKQRAEIQVYFKKFEEAEKLYIEMDRRCGGGGGGGSGCC